MDTWCAAEQLRKCNRQPLPCSRCFGTTSCCFCPSHQLVKVVIKHAARQARAVVTCHHDVGVLGQRAALNKVQQPEGTNDAAARCSGSSSSQIRLMLHGRLSGMQRNSTRKHLGDRTETLQFFATSTVKQNAVSVKNLMRVAAEPRQVVGG